MQIPISFCLFVVEFLLLSLVYLWWLWCLGSFMLRFKRNLDYILTFNFNGNDVDRRSNGKLSSHLVKVL